MHTGRTIFKSGIANGGMGMGFNLYLPTRILFGAGMLNRLHKQNLPGKKALLVISNGKSAKEKGYLARVEEQLRKASVETVVFDRVQANPLKSTVMQGAAFAREHDCDFIAALGGGSVIDTSKAIAMMAGNAGDLWDYVQGGSGKGLPLPNQPYPVVAIATTAGTGSEVDPYAVVTHDEKSEKIGIGGIDGLFPVLAVVDPELMVSVPPRYTAYQGFDALFQSVEGYLSRFANPLSDMYALTALENIARNLAKAVQNGQDLEARKKVAFGSTLSGFVMVAGTLTSHHSLEHALSAYHHHLPHGAGLIMLSKAYFTHLIGRQVGADRFVKMAKVMGMEDAREPMDFIKALERLIEDCGVADLKMSDYGITPDEFEPLAENALNTMGALFKCDRSKLSIEDCVSILKTAFK